MSLLITCPICGRRNGYEFRFGGEEKGSRPDEKDLTLDSWCQYVHLRSHIKGIQKEWWYHRDGCGTWFAIWRDTSTNLEVDKPE